MFSSQRKKAGNKARLETHHNNIPRTAVLVVERAVVENFDWEGGHVIDNGGGQKARRRIIQGWVLYA